MRGVPALGGEQLRSAVCLLCQCDQATTADLYGVCVRR